MKKLSGSMQNRNGQASIILVLVIAGLIGVFASSMLLSSANLNRAHGALRLRSEAIRASEDLAQELKLAYDRARNAPTPNDCTTYAVLPAYVPDRAAPSRFCFLGAPIVYANRFTIRRDNFVASIAKVENTYNPTTVRLDSPLDEDIQPTHLDFSPQKLNPLFPQLLFLRKAFAQFAVAPYPYLAALPAGPGLAGITMNGKTDCEITNKEYCMVCDGAAKNADCFRVDICTNQNPAVVGTCAAPNIMRLLVGFML